MKRVGFYLTTIFLAISGHAQLPDSVLMKNWTDYMTPGKEHKLIASWDGIWSGTVDMWVSPGAPVSTSSVESGNKMIFGGRYQQSTLKGNIMGMKFEGMGLLGFDNEKKEFISIWVDNMGTGVLQTTGKWDDATKSITFIGKSLDPGTKKEIDFKEIFKVVDNNHQIMEMYGPGPDGNEFKTMEIKLTRKK